MTTLTGIGGERYWVHIPATNPRAYKKGGLVAAAQAVKGSPMANDLGDSELVHVNKYEMEKLREMWGEPGINPETGLPAYGLFKVIKKIAGTVAKIGATVVLTPVLGPVGAAAAVNAVSTAISGGDLGDIVKSAGFAAATAGAGQYGAKFAPSLGISADVGRAIGAGLGATGAGLATGQSFEDALTGGAMAGIGTYGINRTLGSAINNNTLGIGDLYQGLTNIGYDISNATGIGGGSNYGVNTGKYSAPGEEIIVTAAPGTNLTYTGSGEVPPVTSKTTSDQPAPKTDEDGEIIVTAPEGTNLTLGPSIPQITSGIGGEELNFDQEGNPIIVNASDTGPGLTITPEAAAAIKQEVAKDKEIVPEEGEIVVTAPVGPGLTLPTNPTVTPPTTNVSASNPYGEVMPFYPDSPTPVATDKTSPLVARGGLYDMNLNRSDIFGKRGVAGIGFDPFTYGQAIEGGQPGEFLFFTQNGRPYGQVAEYTGPLASREPVVVAAQRAAESPAVVANTMSNTTPENTIPDSARLTVTNPTNASPTTQTGGGVRATPENTGMTQERLDQLQDRYENMRSPEFFQYFKSVNDVLGNYTAKGIMTPDQAKAYQSRLETAASKPDASLASLKAAAPMPQISDYLKPTGTRAESPQGLAAAANIPAQTQALTEAPKTGMTAGQYYNKYVAPLAGSYFNSGKLNAEQARGLTNAAFNFVKSNDLSGAQNAVNTYLTNAGLAAPAMAEGGDVDGDDMAAHLMAYHKNGGHTGPGQVKGIGSGQEDKIPAWLSDGEYVWSAQDVADLGDGSTDEGVRRLDKMRQMVRRRAGRKDVKNIAKPQRGIDTMLKAVGGAV